MIQRRALKNGSIIVNKNCTLSVSWTLSVTGYGDISVSSVSAALEATKTHFVGIANQSNGIAVYINAIKTP
jgi:hypothetical protein